MPTLHVSPIGAPVTTAGGGRGRTAVWGLVASAAVVHTGPALCAPLPPVRRVLGVRGRLGDGRRVALTFDDGPHPAGTPATLEVLRHHGAPATFFLAGEQVLRHPAVAREIVAAGHEVALHCHRHRNLLRLTPWQVREDLRRGYDAIADVTGRPPSLYRPPYGVLTGPALALTRSQGLRTVLWTRWGRDWREEATPADVVRDLTGGLRGGEILLLHDADHYSAPGSWATTVAALPQILQEIAGARLELTASCAPRAESSGRSAS